MKGDTALGFDEYWVAGCKKIKEMKKKKKKKLQVKNNMQ